MDEKIIFKEESYKIIGICMNIHSTLGNGFLEAVYCEVLEKEFVKNNIPYQREVKLDLFFNGEKLDKKLGLLINFGEKSLKYKRIINL